MEKLMESKLIKPDGSEVDAKAAFEDKKIIMLYFAQSHWSQGSVAVTPKLKGIYEETKEKGVEVVFVSGCRSAEESEKYFQKEHGNWLRLPHNSEVFDELCEKFEVEQAPHIAVLRGDGTVIEEDAAQDVYRKGASIVDKWINGSDYEKTEKNLEVINEAEFVKHDGSKVSGKDVLAGKKAVAFYFSAHWCPPCRNFTPVLKKFYEEVQEDLEVVFVSADRSKADMESYYKESHGKWLCAEHGSDVSDKLGEHFECPHYPYMVVVRADGTFVTKDGTGDVRSHYNEKEGAKVLEKWL